MYMQVKGTEGDNVASGMGGGIDGASWVKARKERIAREGGVESPIGAQVAGANTYKGEVAYPDDQGVGNSVKRDPTTQYPARNDCNPDV